MIGGEATGCTEATTEVFIEAALFDPVRTAATGRRLNISSDARYRFERGLDPAFVRDGLEIATRLMLDLCGGEASEIVTAGSVRDWRRRYVLRSERPATLGGLDVSPEESVAILTALGFAVERLAGDNLAAEPPSWRGDIEGEADLVEEIVRVKGYDHIPAVPLDRDTALSRPSLTPVQRRAGLVRRSLATRGLTEAVTFSFISAREAELFGGAEAGAAASQPDQRGSRRDAAFAIARSSRRRNADRGFPDAALFELGPLYRDDTPAGQALRVAAGLRAGHAGPAWRAKEREVDLYDVKSDALAALAAMGTSLEGVGRGGSTRLVSSRARRDPTARE